MAETVASSCLPGSSGMQPRRRRSRHPPHTDRQYEGKQREQVDGDPNSCHKEEGTQMATGTAMAGISRRAEILQKDEHHHAITKYKKASTNVVCYLADDASNWRLVLKALRGFADRAMNMIHAVLCFMVRDNRPGLTSAGKLRVACIRGICTFTAGLVGLVPSSKKHGNVQRTVVTGGGASCNTYIFSTPLMAFYEARVPRRGPRSSALAPGSWRITVRLAEQCLGTA
ncbi:hypothetical protein FQR65_LT20190 [Abscondita terminalis]|nr:hypothetical protein FQR65_LT20190 [Abscondita terminalis]